MATEAIGGTQGSLVNELPVELSFNRLEKITNNFSKQRELGTGAFGVVYMGILEDGGVIAVKKLEENAPGINDKRTYSTKIQSIMKHKHKNTVRLLAFCHEERKKLEWTQGRNVFVDVVESLLCYEYLPMGSLHKKLFGEPTCSIDWNTRFKIIEGICQGLQSLHKLPEPIIHLDLKPQNILLDANMSPKIADFGYSRIFGPEKTRTNTKSSIGSVGYKAPEYLHKNEISARTDIYSLGLMILEITTREKICPSIDQQSAMEYIDMVRENWKDEELIMSEYPELEQDRLHQLTACIRIGLECVDLDQDKRPTIVQIVDKLNALW